MSCKTCNQEKTTKRYFGFVSLKYIEHNEAGVCVGSGIVYQKEMELTEEQAKKAVDIGKTFSSKLN
jgi:hypothetical protein